MIKKLRFILIAFVLAFMVGPAQASVFFQISDSAAGEEVPLFVSGLQAAESVSVRIEKPDKSELNFVLQADQEGFVRDQVYGLHVQQAGDYKATLERFGSQYLVENDTFEIAPGSVSAFKSEVELERLTVPADSLSAIPFRFTAKDAYGNPVKDAAIQVVSSRNADDITAQSITDTNGLIRGSVVSGTPGASVISFVVNDTVIQEKAEMIFHLNGNDLVAVGQGTNESGVGQFLQAQLFDSGFKEAAYFVLETLPTEVESTKNYTVKVAVKDEDGSTVQDYQGQIRFVSSDSQAQLPRDYTFTAEDQGEHTFALAVTFGTPGEQTLNVIDTTNAQVEGEMTLQVSDKTPGGGAGAIGEIKILAPVAGTSNAARVTISGTAPSSASIEIVDGPTVLVSELIVPTSGSFTYETPTLADGLHRFKVFSSDKALESNEVAIRIDKTPPRALAVKLDPADNIPAGSTFSVEVSSDEALSLVSCTFNGLKQDFVPSGEAFSGNFQAPVNTGEFPISCTVADIIGNELNEPQVAVANIVDGEDDPEPPNPDPIKDTPLVDPITPGDSNVAPTAVSSLSAQAEENQVTLIWAPATDDKGIASYKIDFGIAPDSMTSSNMTPDNRTQWYVDGLTAGTKYFFRITATDNEGNLGAPSNVIESTTTGGDFRSAAVPVAGLETWLPYVLSAIFGILFLFVSRRRTI